MPRKRFTPIRARCDAILEKRAFEILLAMTLLAGVGIMMIWLT